MEVLAAVAITALLLGGLGGALKAMSGAAARGTAAVDRADMLARGIGAFRRDVAALRREVTGLGAATAYVFQADDALLRFVTVEPPYPSQAGSYLVTYRIVRSETGSQLIRSREAHHPKIDRARAQRDISSDVVVIEGPYDMALSYRGARSTADEPAWRSTWPHRDEMPVLVRLDVVPRHAREAALPAIVVRPRVDAEAGCVWGAGQPCTPETGALKARTQPQTFVPPAQVRYD